MQLLKQNLPNNPASKHHATKLHTKNYYLNILQSCMHVPKDDRLMLRKYICGLKQFNDSNEILATLLKYSKKVKENVDKKLQIVLRKHADKIRKIQNMQIISNKVEQIPVKITKCEDVLNSRKFSTNFQILKQSLRFLSAKNSASNSRQGSPHNSNSKNKQKIDKQNITQNKYENSNFFSTRSYKIAEQKQNSKKYKSPLKNILNYKNNKNIYRSLVANYQQANDNRPNVVNQNFQQTHKNFSKQKQQAIMNRFKNTSKINNSYKHKPSRSQSLQYLINQNEIKYNMQRQKNLPKPTTSNKQNQNAAQFQLYQQKNIKFCEDDQKIIISQQLQPSSSTSPYDYVSKNNFYTCQFKSKIKSPHFILKDLKIYSQDLLDFIIPANIRQTRSPSDLSLTYSQFIQNTNKFISNLGYDQTFFCSAQTIYIPFHTHYDLVTFQKLIQFAQEYTCFKLNNNPVRDIYNRISWDLNGNYPINFSYKRINVQQFNRCYEWKKVTIKTKFLELIKKANQWGNFITYWQFYWLKNSGQFKQFQEEFCRI